MFLRICWTSIVLAVCVAALPFPAQAQARINISGRLVNSLSGDPIPNAVVQIDELRRMTTSGSNGTFTLSDVPPGTYHVSVHADGYSSRPMEVSVSTTELNLGDFAVDPELHFQEQTTVTGEARSNFEVYQPTAVLAGQELTKQLGMSLGATLESQPGVASRSFGPAPARPVIRGLDGDRVQILQDGQRMGDLSSQSGDHGVTINPAAATRIDVVRGPATLLYGTSAIGGLVNVITEDIPTRPLEGSSGNVTFDVGSAAREAATAGDIRAGNGRFALHAGGGGRTGQFTIA
jgi:iron complex outermembrane recepter protein